MPTGPSLPDTERTSQRLLVKLDSGSVPIDVHSIARLWTGLSIIEEDIDGPGYLLPLGSLGAEIIIRQSDPVERKRFTIAHELGHWVLGITCERKTGKFEQPAGLRHDTIERWCDAFAASFLVPRQLLVEYFRGIDDQLLATHLLAAPRHFRVSEDAMFLHTYEVLRMRIAYFEPRSSKILRAFVPDAIAAQMERAISLPSIRDWLHLETFAQKIEVDSTWFTCCWNRLSRSGRSLIVLNPLSRSKPPISRPTP